jgi:hypothetical protein
MGDIFVQYDLPRPERANNRRVDGWRLCYTLLDTDDLAVLDTCPDVIDSIPKLMRDEKNIEDAQKEGHELFLDVCESFRYGVMSYGSEQGTPKEVLIQREIQAIPSNTEKYITLAAIDFAPAHGGHRIHDSETTMDSRASVVTSPNRHMLIALGVVALLSI